tara:strand:+ start:40 stop:513 length:474 start_codon:yes stop_codon:yes gene_type:complete
MGKSHDLATIAADGLSTLKADTVKVDTIQNTSGTGALIIDSSGDLTFSGSNTVTPTDSGWITPTLNSGFTSYNSPYGPIKYRKIGNIVNIQGITNQASGGSIVFTLPVGFRPERRVLFATQNNSSLGRLDIDQDGNVRQNTVASSGWFSLNCTFFTA